MDLDKVLQKDDFTKEDLLFLIKLEKKDDLEKLYKKAYSIKLNYTDNKVFLRGIIEFSNICIKDCYYCGIRKSNNEVNRFIMKKEEILKSVKWIYENDYASLVLQSGERTDAEYISFVDDLIKGINDLSDKKLRMTLSLGEQTEKTYKKWKDLGAERYLLRIETTNEELYKKLHPEDHSFKERVKCLEILKKLGYQTGTGVMIGLPGQTDEDLVNDILFFKEKDIDMIGMGPYVVCENSPLSKIAINTKEEQNRRFNLGIKMIALTRLYLKDINIAATTALQTLNPIGRELGLKAGANVVMPIITDVSYKRLYQLYDGKACLDDNADECKQCLTARVRSVGDEVAYSEWGDSKHYTK